MSNGVLNKSPNSFSDRTTKFPLSFPINPTKLI
jgi:hypothetical protein